MATWHIRPIIPEQQSTVIGYVISARYTALFEAEGFVVSPLPFHLFGITVSHARASAFTLFLLKHELNSVTVTQVV
jgi:hypothetical protein